MSRELEAGLKAEVEAAGERWEAEFERARLLLLSVGVEGRS